MEQRQQQPDLAAAGAARARRQQARWVRLGSQQNIWLGVLGSTQCCMPVELRLAVSVDQPVPSDTAAHF